MTHAVQLIPLIRLVLLRYDDLLEASMSLCFTHRHHVALLTGSALTETDAFERLLFHDLCLRLVCILAVMAFLE